MFSNDPNKLSLAISKFKDLIYTFPDGLKDVTDVVFKWICVILADSNNPISIKFYDFLSVLLSWLISENYVMSEQEAKVILVMLCDKSGNNNVIMKNKAKA